MKRFMVKLKSHYKAGTVEAGLDEAGRGCLAGPVYAAAVILPEDYFDPLLNDSKQLSRKNRDLLRKKVETDAVSWAVGHATAGEIDKINILNASYLAMHRAIEKLNNVPECLLVDGNRFKPYKKIPFHCMVKGDARFFSIAAASILAKTYRDEFMEKIHKDFPAYDWGNNMGYPTKKHRQAIKKYGTTKWHRKSFRLLEEQLKMKFSQ